MEDFCFPPIQKKGSVGSVGVLLECADLEIEKDANLRVCVCVAIFFSILKVGIYQLCMACLYLHEW